MADICDEHGNPIQLTDEHGRPVQLTDEHGVPMHLTGVATTIDSQRQATRTTIDDVDSETKMHGGTNFNPIQAEPVVGATGVNTTTMSGVKTTAMSGVNTTTMSGGGQPPCHPGVGGAEGGVTQQLGRVGSSSSSSSEDDGEGGRRRRKKGLMQKIKEKLPGYKNKEAGEVPGKVYTATTKVTVETPGGPPDVAKTEEIRVEHYEEEHEKKGFMDKIKDKIPGHHSH